MDRSTLDAIVMEVEGYIENDTTRLWATEAPQNASNYADSAWLEKEQRVLRSHPVIVGHSCRIKSRGDFFTHDATGLPIIVANAITFVLAFIVLCLKIVEMRRKN